MACLSHIELYAVKELYSSITTVPCIIQELGTKDITWKYGTKQTFATVIP